MSLPLEKVLQQSSKFLDQIFFNLNADGVRVDEMELDHICYRVESFTRYFELKNQLNEKAKLLVASEIGGREIATFKLENPIRYKKRKIYCFELPAPKEGSLYKEGFEHVEFVLNTDFITFLNQHPKISFNQKGLTKEINADLKIGYGELAVKFHLKSLEQVIKIELNEM